MGHSSNQCTAKETGTILVLHNLLEELLQLPSIPVSLVSQLRNHAPPITIRRIMDHYDNFDEESEDELDKEATSKVEQNSTDEFSFTAPTSSYTMNAAEEVQATAADNIYPPTPIVAKPSTTSAGIILYYIAYMNLIKYLSNCCLLYSKYSRE